MKCPVCDQPLVIVEWNDVELDMCIDGHGLWFDDQELRQLFLGSDDPEAGAAAVYAFEARLLELPADEHRPVRRCPRCDAAMKHVVARHTGEGGGEGHGEGPVLLDACPRGDGLWFDDGELEAALVPGPADDIAGMDRVREFLAGFRAPHPDEGRPAPDDPPGSTAAPENDSP